MTGNTTCRGCGAEIIFIKTQKMKTIPCDPEPVHIRQDIHGNTYVRKDGTFVIGETVGDAFDDPDTNLIEAYVSHFATCPVGGKFRKPRERKRSGGFR